MEQHFGEIAIQRLHKRKLYQKGAQRIMSEMEFYETIRFALAFVEFLPSESDLRMVFEAVDSDKDGYISYEDYFRFLK
jgi:Ca2+-binding EF-hand superfamily protein